MDITAESDLSLDLALDIGITEGKVMKSFEELLTLHKPPASAKVLHTYQREIVDSYLDWRNDSKLAKNDSIEAREALIGISMGLGKTLIAAECIKSEIARGGQVLWITHRKDLKGQSAGVIEAQTGLAVSTRLSKKTKNVHVTGNTIGDATLRKLKSKLEPTLIVIDEAQHAFAETYRRIKVEFPNAKILNLTATPYRGDVANEMNLGTKLAVINPSDAIADGFLAPYRTVAKITHDFSSVGTALGDYKNGALSKLMRTPEMLKASTEAIVNNSIGRRGLVYCCNKAHAYEVENHLTTAGLKVGIVLDTTNDLERKELYRKLEDGEIDQIINVNCLTEGLDLPAVDMISILRPTKNAALYVQMLGRGLRLCPVTGKIECIVIDALDVAKVKGKAEGTQVPFEEELIRHQVMMGIPVSAAALYLTWFEGYSTPATLNTPKDVFQAVNGKLPTVKQELALAKVWDTRLLDPKDPSGFDTLAFTLGCNGLEHLHKVLIERGFQYNPHGMAGPATTVSLGIAVPTKRTTVKAKGLAKVSKAALNNLVLDLLDKKVTSIEALDAQLVDNFVQNVQTYWYKDPLTDIEYITKPPTYDPSHSIVLKQEFLIKSPKGRFVKFITHPPLADPAHPYVTDDVGAPVKYPNGKGGVKTLESLGKFKYLNLADIPPKHFNDERLKELFTPGQRYRVAKDYGLTRRQSAELTLSRGLASFLIDQKTNYVLDILEHVNARIGFVDTYLDKKGKPITPSLA